MKKILKALLVLVGMIAMLFVVAVIVNLSVFDEELLPEVQAIKDIQAKPYTADNAYPALLALTYYPDLSYQSATTKIRELLNKKIADKSEDFLSEADYESIKNQKISFQQISNNISCQTRTEKNCIQKYINKMTPEISEYSESLILLNRYEQLINYNKYSEATQLKLILPLPAFGPVLNTQRVYLIKNWLENKQEFLSTLLKDFSYWRMMLKDGHYLITKMVAVAAITHDIHFLAYAIQSGELNNNQLLQAQNQISPLSSQEKSLIKTFKFEMKYAINSFDYYNKEGEDLFSKLLYQPQATTNLYYSSNIRPLMRIDELDSRSFYQAFQTKEWPSKPELKTAISLYNPTGKLLITVTIFAYQDYFARMHDLDAMLTLLNLRIELALNNDQNIPSVVNNSKHKNPYTNQPFDYDSDQQTIGFDCLDKTSVCEIAL